MRVAYEPATWRIDLAPGTRVAATHVFAHYDQRIEGLPPGTPRFDATSDYGDLIEDSIRARVRRELLEREVGVPVRAQLGCYRGARFSVGGTE